MDRRNIIYSIPTVFMGLSCSLAGCSQSSSEPSTATSESDSGSGSGPGPGSSTRTSTTAQQWTGCPPKSATLAEILPPESDRFSNRERYDPPVDIQTTAQAAAAYQEQSGKYRVEVYAFETQSDLSDSLPAVKSRLGSLGGTTGYVVRNQRIITAQGPDKATIKSLLLTSSFIGDSCIRSFRFE